MRDEEPPGIATSLAQRFVSGPRRESLVGDLIEQHRQGRSSLWYWRQVLTAIVIGAIYDVGAHKLLAVRALMIGWTLYVLFSFPVIWLSRIVHVWIGEALSGCEPHAFWCQFWRNQLSAELLVYAACAVSGWMVVRFHREHGVATLFLYATSVLLFEYGMMGWMLARHGIPPTAGPRAALILPAVFAIGRPLSVLVGGMWSIPSDGGVLQGVPPSAPGDNASSVS